MRTRRTRLSRHQVGKGQACLGIAGEEPAVPVRAPVKLSHLWRLDGTFLRARLIDEISLAIFAAVDGAKGAPSIFDSSDKDAGIAAPIRSMTLASCEVLRRSLIPHLPTEG
ncbi:MAG TPA: hypothetical protein VFW40_05270 [Capsulimonadaceae bacterium]|nr:hypothetical protein [Capsulimonadaceae bacterium]